MVWSFRHGRDTGKSGISDNEFIKQMRAENPDAFADTPDLDPPEITYFESEYVNAFFMLTRSRQNGMGLGAIPLSEILKYCEFFEPEDPELLIHIIQRVDSAYMEEYNKEQEQKNPKK